MAESSSQAQKSPRAPARLSTWLAGTLVLTVVATVVPGIWFTTRSFQKALVSQEIDTLRTVHEEWALRLGDYLGSAEISARRLGRLLTEEFAAEGRAEDAADFDRFIARDPDGCWRSRASTFNPARDAGIWIPPAYPILANDAERAFFVRVKRTLEQYHTGTNADFPTTWVIPRMNGIAVVYPGDPNYLRTTTADLDYSTTDWVTLASQERNPDGVPLWTPVMYDPSGVWAVTVVVPFYRNGARFGGAGHDILLRTLKANVQSVVLHEGSNYHLVQADGTLLVSDTHEKQIQETQGQFHIDAIGDSELTQAFEAAKRDRAGGRLTFMTGNAESPRVIIAAHLRRPDWYLLSVVPRTSLLTTVQASYKMYWFAIAAALLAVIALPLVVVVVVTRSSVKRLLIGAEHISDGDLEHRFDVRGVRELHRVGEALNAMVDRIRASIEERIRTQAALEESEASARAMLDEIQQKLVIIEEQRNAIRSMSTPVIQVWKDVLALPVVGALDSARVAALMETLLQTIVSSGTRVAIVDLTGVEEVDDATADYLLKIMRAVNLLGAKGIVTGIRQNVARRMISLGVDMSSIMMLGTLREALQWYIGHAKGRRR